MPSGRLPNEPAGTDHIARMLARLDPRRKGTSRLQRAAIEWFKGISNKQDRLAVIFLSQQIYNAMRQDGHKKFFVIDALEATAVLLYEKRIKQAMTTFPGYYTIKTMNVSTEAEKTHHAPAENLIDYIEMLEGYNLAILQVIDPDGNTVDNWQVELYQ